MAAMVVLLWPMVSKILAFNYSDRYSYYNVGGIAVELYYHAMRTGLLNLIFDPVWFVALRQAEKAQHACVGAV